MLEKEKRDSLVLFICRFLHENKCLDKFCNNTLNYHVGINIPKSLSLSEKTRFLIGDRLDALYEEHGSWPIWFSDFICRFSSAFDWGYAPEGCRFWGDISDKWKELCKEYDTIKQWIPNVKQ